MKTYLLKFLFKTVLRKCADSPMPDYSLKRRQWVAFGAGISAALPIAIAVVLFKLFSEDLSGLEHAAHTPLGALLILVLLGAGIVLVLLNYGTPVLAIFVIASLAYDVYKLRNWRNSKCIALCGGLVTVGGGWYWCAMRTEELLFISLADVAPFLSSASALMLMFVALTILPRPRMAL